MKNSIISAFEKKMSANAPEMPKFRAGDTVRVHYKIQEGSDASKFRLQPFEGVVIRFKKGTHEGTFTVRKISANGIGVERVFPLFTSQIAKVEVLSSGVVRRARLYYLRNLTGKAARIPQHLMARSEA